MTVTSLCKTYSRSQSLQNKSIKHKLSPGFIKEACLSIYIYLHIACNKAHDLAPDKVISLTYHIPLQHHQVSLNTRVQHFLSVNSILVPLFHISRNILSYHLTLKCLGCKKLLSCNCPAKYQH